MGLCAMKRVKAALELHSGPIINNESVSPKWVWNGTLKSVPAPMGEVGYRHFHTDNAVLLENTSKLVDDSANRRRPANGLGVCDTH